MDRWGERQVGTSAVGKEQWDGSGATVGVWATNIPGNELLTLPQSLCLSASPIVPEVLGHLP